MKTTHEPEKMKTGSPPTMKQIFVALLAVFAVSSPVVVSAVDVTGASSSYVMARERVDSTKLLTGYEYLNFAVQNIGNETISAHFGGWANFDFKEETGDADLQYAYVSYRSNAHNAVVNLGRVMVFDGLAAERVDGLYARTDLAGGIGLSVFGGSPVETGANLPGNSMIYGGRISHRNAGLYTIGVSYLNEDKNSDVWRQEGGVDLWFRPASSVELTGKSSYNLETSGWMEHSYYLALGPFDRLRLNTEASRINYEDYFSGATTSLFRILAGGPLAPEESVTTVGETVTLAITDTASASWNFKKYNHEQAGDARSYGVSANLSVPRAGGMGVSVQRTAGESARLCYYQYRLYGFLKSGKSDIALDIVNVKYDETINGIAAASSATLGVGRELTEKLKIGADVEYAKNPDFDKEVRVFAKMVYNFDFASGSRSGGAEQGKPGEVK